MSGAPRAGPGDETTQGRKLGPEKFSEVPRDSQGLSIQTRGCPVGIGWHLRGCKPVVLPRAWALGGEERSKLEPHN